MKIRNGAAARELLLRLIRRDGPYRGIAVNRSHCMNLAHPLIKSLLKKGLVKTVRSVRSSKTSYTILVPADDVYLEGPVHCPECKNLITGPHGGAHKPGCSVVNFSFYRLPDNVNSPAFKKQINPWRKH